MEERSTPGLPARPASRSDIDPETPPASLESAPRADARWSRSDLAVLLAIVVAFLLTRLFWLAARPDTGSYWEETYRWIAAYEILNDPTRPLLDYQADHYQGGSLLMILLAVPAISTLGNSVFAVKLPAILWSTSTLVLLFAVARRWFGRGVATLCGLAFLTGPPLVAFWGMTLMGFHAESAFLSLAQIGLFLRLLTGARRDALTWASFGLACGAGVSFTYITLLSAAACALTWSILRARSPRLDLRVGELGWLAAGALVGLAPWIAYNATHDFAGLTRVAEVFGLRESPDQWGGSSFADRIAELLWRVPVEGLVDPTRTALGDGWRPVFAAAILVPTVPAFAAAALRSGRVAARSLVGRASQDTPDRLELVFVVYAFLFLAAYLSSRFSLLPEPSAVAYRLFPPLFVLMLVPISTTVWRWSGAGGSVGALRSGAVAIGLIASASATLALATRPTLPADQLSFYAGYTVQGILHHRKYDDLARALVEVGPVSDPLARELVYRGIGWEIENRVEAGRPLPDLEAALAHLDQYDRAALLTGLGWAASQRIQALESRGSDLGPDERETVRRLRALTEMLEPGDDAP